MQGDKKGRASAKGRRGLDCFREKSPNFQHVLLNTVRAGKTTGGRSLNEEKERDNVSNSNLPVCRWVISAGGREKKKFGENGGGGGGGGWKPWT